MRQGWIGGEIFVVALSPPDGAGLTGLVVLVPVVVVFYLAQRTFVEGITLTGIKG